MAIDDIDDKNRGVRARGNDTKSKPGEADMSEDESDYTRIMRETIERHISPATGELDMDSALAELKVALDVPDESMGNLESTVWTWFEQDYPPTPAQVARWRAQRRQSKINELRSGHVEAWRNDDDLL
jgi:hypothetical protein